MAGFNDPPVRGHILIVEDESGVRAALAMILEMEGFAVRQAADGRQGLHCLIESIPDVLITDYMMPYMNGMEMIREIRSKPDLSTLPIVMLTAAIPSEADARSMIDVLIMKPVELPYLIETVQTLIMARGRKS